MPATDQPTLRRRPRLTPLGLLCDIAAGAWSILLGHWVTLINFWRKKVTDRYPHRNADLDWKPRPGYRGDFALITDRKAGRLKCIACMQCANICPAGCIHIKAEGKGRQRRPVEFYIDAGLCMYCWLCVEVCPVGAITMTPDYEMAVEHPAKLVRDIEYLTARGLEYDEPLLPEGR